MKCIPVWLVCRWLKPLDLDSINSLCAISHLQTWSDIQEFTMLPLKQSRQRVGFSFWSETICHFSLNQNFVHGFLFIIDLVIGRVFEACKQHSFVLLVTADHGNAEQMMTPDGKPHTAHTTNRGMPCSSRCYLLSRLDSPLVF